MKQTGSKQRFEIINLAAEKRKFLFDTKYNPQFIYSEPVETGYLNRYGEVETIYLPAVTNILDTVIKEFGTEQAYIQATEGDRLTREEVESRIHSYLIDLGVDNIISLSYSQKYIARTAVKRQGEKFVLQIRLPLDYRQKNLMPILHHEIGTHVFRWLNDAAQPWSNRHREFSFSDHLETEEGLAVLNYQTANEQPYLWMPALYYFAAYHAQTLSFAGLFKLLEKYVPDVERRWKTCLRVKRGFADTSLPGTYSKDQIYFRGTVLVAQWLRAHNYDVKQLYVGKLGLADLKQAWSITPDYQPLLPSFVTTAEWVERVKHITKINKLPIAA